jgi:hypothetical protein
MDSGAQQSLRRTATLAATALAILGLVGWLVPVLFDTEPSPRVATRAPVDTLSIEEVDHFITDTLGRFGAIQVISRPDSDGIVRGIYQLPKGAETAMIAQRFRGFAEEVGVELYASPVDGLDLEIRAYAGPKLRQQLLLVPDLPNPPKLKGAIRNPDRPMLSVVITNVGESSIDKLLKVRTPITVAIKPYTPFALRTARIAANQWHEVLAHVPPEMTPQEAQRAVPLATGIWYDGTPVAPLSAHDVVVVPADRVSGARTPEAIRVVAAQRSDRRDSLATLNRARHIAAKMGRAALVVEADDPGIDDILAWAVRAHQDGYRIVLASEAARWRELRGPE